MAKKRSLPAYAIVLIAIGVLAVLAAGSCLYWPLLPHEDDEAVAWFEAEGATVVRWPRKDPLSLLGAASNGQVQGVGYHEREVTDRHLDALLPHRRCTGVSFRKCRINARLEKLAEMEALDTLDIIDCGFLDADLPPLLALTRLRYLYLEGNPLTDAAISTLAKMTWLKSLWLTDTKITPEGFHALRDRMPMTNIRSMGP